MDNLDEPNYIKTKELTKYFKKKGLTIKTPNEKTLTIKQVLTQYHNQETIQSIQNILKNEITEEIKVYEQCTEMTTKALAEHITDIIFNNIELIKQYIILKESIEQCQTKMKEN